MYNRRYEKVFLMLRQETAGYALGKRPPWGSCVMELKNGTGRLHLTAQGLKSCWYEIYVMAGEESIFCGEVCPEQKEGRCELKWEFDPDAIGDGKKAEDLHTIIFLAEGGSAPLTAYFKEKKDWKHIFQERKREETILQTAETAVIIPERQEAEKDIHMKVAEKQKDCSQGSIHGSFQGLLAKFRQELEELEESGILTKEETEHIRNMGSEAVIAEEKTANKGLKEDIVSDKGWYPFGDGEKWNRITLEEMSLLSRIPLKWQREFFFLLPYRKYHHLILQEKAEGVHLGLPGQFNTEDAADAHAFGFHEFRNTNGDWGYWLTFLEGNG